MFSVQDDSIENQLSLTKHESNFFSFSTKNILLKMIKKKKIQQGH